MLKRVSIIGRTNVGKSTLFNRLSRSREAIVFDMCGVTRDLRERIVDIYDKKCVLVDSPGMFDYDTSDINNPTLLNEISKKLLEAIKTSDIVLFVIDGLRGITEYDMEVATIIRKSGISNIVTVVNKSERRTTAESSYIESLEFGFGDTIAISAEHGDGITDLLDSLHERLPNCNHIADIETSIRIAIVGRPNVGKSTISNKIFGQDIRLVADMPGVTRESLSSSFVAFDRKIEIVDTPGVRRSSRIQGTLEKISASNTRKSYRNADVVILVIDASSLVAGEIERQDITLANHIAREGKPLVIVFNKWDLTPYSNAIPDFIKRNMQHSLSQIKDAPTLFSCALDGTNVRKVLLKAINLYDQQSIRIKTSDLNNWLSNFDVFDRESTKFKLKYMTQIGGIPPKFLIFASNVKHIRNSHSRCMVNSLKKTFDLQEMPVQIFFREQKS